GHPVVIAAIRDEIDARSGDALDGLAADLVARAPHELDHAYPVSSGGEAVEAAVKLAKHYFVARGEPARRNVIARRPCATRVAPRLIAPCYAYRHRRDDETEEHYGRRAADELERAILELGPDTVCAFVAETVVGASLGAVPAVRGYFRRIREICTAHGVLLIL